MDPSAPGPTAGPPPGADLLALLRCPACGADAPLHVADRTALGCANCARRYARRPGYLDLVANDLLPDEARAAAAAMDYARGRLWYAILGSPPLARAWFRRRWGVDLEALEAAVDARLEGATGDGGAPVLDVPVGSSRGLRRHGEAPPGRAVLGVDLSVGMLAEVEETARRRPVGGLVLARADVARLPLASGSVGAVVAPHSLHAFPDPVGALAELGRVLAPGARLAGSCLDRAGDGEDGGLEPRLAEAAAAAGLRGWESERLGPALAFSATGGMTGRAAGGTEGDPAAGGG